MNHLSLQITDSAFVLLWLEMETCMNCWSVSSSFDVLSCKEDCCCWFYWCGGLFEDLTCPWWEFHPSLVDFSTNCGFVQRIGGYKTGCSTGAWWIFPRPVVLTSEDHAQNRVFHRWPVDFSTTCGFSSEKLKDYVDSKRFKRKRKYKEER